MRLYCRALTPVPRPAPQVLGGGAISKALTVRAAAFSGSAKAAIAAAGGQAEELAAKAVWTKKAHKAMVAAMAEKGLKYEEEAAKKRAARQAAKAQK